jgi:1-acyl-sn-glycerol-3-phosphate acyltransferase
MSLLTVVSPGLKALFDRIGRPEIIHLPPVLQLGGTGAVIACNHVGWADSLWMAYAVYPRHLRYMSKEQLFGSPLARWVLQQGGSIPIDRSDPLPSSIKTAVDVLQNGEIVLTFRPARGRLRVSPSSEALRRSPCTPGFRLCPPSIRVPRT